MKDKFLNALDSVTWYNGLAEYVFKWFFLEPDVCEKINYQQIACPDNYCMDCSIEDNYAYHQLQVLWMIAVEMFGDCGTSPRFGWIEKVDEFRKWILDITAEWRGSYEYNGPDEYRNNWEEDDA